MNRKLTIVLLLAASGCLAAAAQAQAVYRCGDSYSQQPCPGGKPVQVEDARSADQRADSLKAAQRDAKWAEAKAARSGIPPPKAAAADDAAVKPVALGKPTKADQFAAVSPRKASDAAAKKKKKAKAKPKKPAA